jgi:hypothetical protein
LQEHSFNRLHVISTACALFHLLARYFNCLRVISTACTLFQSLVHAFFLLVSSFNGLCMLAMLFQLLVALIAIQKNSILGYKKSGRKRGKQDGSVIALHM